MKYIFLTLIALGLAGCCGDLKDSNSRMNSEILELKKSNEELGSALTDCQTDRDSAREACEKALPTAQTAFVDETAFVTSPCSEALTIRLSQLDETRVYLQYAVSEGPEVGSYYSDALYHNDGLKRHRNAILVGKVLVSIDYCGASSCQVSCVDLTVEDLTCGDSAG